VSNELEQVLVGHGVSQGIAIGRAVCLEAGVEEVYRFPLPEDQLDDEVHRLSRCVEQAVGELRRIREGHVETSLEEDIGGVLDAHLLLLQDPELLDKVEEKIRTEQVNAEWAVHRVIQGLSEYFSTFDDEYLRGRQQDLLDVGTYLLRALQGISHHELSEIEGDIILVADDLPPAEAVRLGRQRVSGFALEFSGRTSHTTIIARSLKIPAVGGLEQVTSLVTDQDPVIIDGEAGKVVLHPTDETLAAYRDRQTELRRQDELLRETSEQVSLTADGTPITLMANIDLPEEIQDARSYGAQGVGLYRSEFLYIERSPALPSEEEQVEVYRELALGVAPFPVIVRTYDLGGRKLARELMDARGENPVLGLRGIRLTLARPEIFRTQVRALLRAAVDQDIRIMLPLISNLDEVRSFRRFAAELLDELEAEGLACRRDYSLGVMIEVPAAVWISDILAKEVDFFSIGTNDLIQYSLAVDRSNDSVQHLYQPLHPAVLRMLQRTIQCAEDSGIRVGICGEMAADPRCTPLLLGLGLRRLSVSPRMIPRVKARLRALDLSEARSFAERCLEMGTASRVEESLHEFLEQPGSGRQHGQVASLR